MSEEEISKFVKIILDTFREKEIKPSDGLLWQALLSSFAKNELSGDDLNEGIKFLEQKNCIRVKKIEGYQWMYLTDTGCELLEHNNY